MPNLAKLLVFCWFEQSTYNVAWGLPEHTLLLVFSSKKIKYCVIIWKIFFACLIATSQVCLYIWDAFFKFLRKINHGHIIWISKLLIPFLYFGLCEYQSYRTGEIRIEPFKNETGAEGLVLISFFLCLSLFYMKTKMQEWKWRHDIRKTFHPLQQSGTGWTLYLPSNFKNRRPGIVKKKQNPNKTKQCKATAN